MTKSDNTLYDIIFRGDIMPGHQIADVKKKLAQLFKADEQKINALFAGGAVPLKRNLEQAAAQKYQAVLRQAGADVQLAAAGSVTAKAPPKRARPETVVKPQEPVSLQQRLAAQEAQREAEQATQETSVASEPDGFTIAPVGADLLDVRERVVVEPVAVDVGQISLRPLEGNLVDASELQRPEPVSVTLADYGLSELGDDLLKDSEKIALPLIEIEIPEVELAPVGSQLGQLKSEPAPPAPDTSRLSLEP